MFRFRPRGKARIITRPARDVGLKGACWINIFNQIFHHPRYPVLLLFLPYVSGLVLGFPAFAGWVVLAALAAHSGNIRTGGQAIRETITVLMAGTGLWLGLQPGPAETITHAASVPLMKIDGMIRDGPWPVRVYGKQMELLYIEDGAGERCRIMAAGPPIDKVMAGDRIRVTGRFHMQGRLRSMETDTELIRYMGKGESFGFLRGVYLARKALWQGMRETLYRKTAGLAATMLLGIPGQVDPDLRETFRHTGTAHLLAISGLHMGLITVMLVWCLSRMGIHENHRTWIMIPLLGLFCLLTGCKIPVLRAWLVCVFYLLSARIHRRTDPFDPLCLVCLIVLLIQPQAIYEVSFQLSFAGYTAILVFMRMKSGLPGMRSDRKRRRGGNGPYVIMAARYAKAALMLLGISSASWLGTMPLTAHYFQTFIPWAPLINVLAFPFFLVSLMSGAVHLLAMSIGLGGSLATQWPVEFGMSLLCDLLRLLSRLPCCVIRTSSFSATAVVVSYGLIVLAVIAGSLLKGRLRVMITSEDRDPASFQWT